MLIKNEFPAIPIIEQIHITSMHSLFKIHYECGFEFPGETHDFWECLYILDGELCVSADERIYNMSQGELIFHKPLEFHKFIVNNPKGATVLTFSFSAGGPLTFWLRNKVFKLSQEQTQIIDSLLVVASNIFFNNFIGLGYEKISLENSFSNFLNVLVRINTLLTEGLCIFLFSIDISPLNVIILIV